MKKLLTLLALMAMGQVAIAQCITSGVTDQYTYVVAVDATDHVTRETGLSSFTVYRSRNGAAAAAFTTPTVNETDATNMPGVYELLLDEDMSIDSGDDVQHMTVHITHAGMAPVTKEICIARAKITAGNTLAVASDGDLVEVNTLTGHTAQTGDAFARLGAPAGASVSADVAAVKVDTAAILVDTGTTLQGEVDGIQADTEDLQARTPAALVSGRMDASVGAYQTGLTPLQPTVVGRTVDIASTGEAGIDLDNILFSGNGPLPAFGIIDRGTAQAADASSITLRAGFSTAAANMVGVSAWVYSSTNGLHARCLATAYNNTSKVLTCGGLGEAPTGTVLYAIYATPSAQITGTQTFDLTGNITGNLSGSVGSVTGAVGSVTGNVGGNVTGSVASVVNLEQAALEDALVVNCEVNTANFAGSTTTVACILTDRDGGAITAASGDLEGRELAIRSGAQIYEGRFINDTTWDAANSELRLTFASNRPFAATLADAVTAIIR